tara:strand:+ start:459 stop:1091 length:633 start_codon:yes stop_codon:yes gene_type:complete
MPAKQIEDKGLISKFLEQGIKILLKKECKKINNLKIDIIASSLQIIKGKIKNIYIFAEDIDYKGLVFDKIKIEANGIEINFKLNKKKLNFQDNILINFRISLSEKSLKNILLSNRWNWIKDIITKEILNKSKLEDIKINADKILMKTQNTDRINNEVEKIHVKTERGKIYLLNKAYKKSIEIPIEDKIYIKNIYFEDNFIIIQANSSINL